MERRYLIAFWDAMNTVYGYPWRNGKEKEHELTQWYKLFTFWELTVDELRAIVNDHQQRPQQYAPSGGDIRRQLVSLREREQAKHQRRHTVKGELELEMLRRAELFRHDNLASIDDCLARASRYLGYDVSRETFPAKSGDSR